MRTLLRSLTDIVFPNVCALCRRPTDDLLCPVCAKKLPRAAQPVHAAPDKPYSLLAAPLDYRGDTRTVIHLFKYGGRPESAAWFARFIHDFLLEYAIIPSRSFDMVTSVPMHRAKRRLRGFDQAACLAQQFSQYACIPYARLLTKTSDAASQTTKKRHDRIRDARGLYTCTTALSPGARIILIDDVCTSGATITACAEALKKAGAQDIIAVTIARAIA